MKEVTFFISGQGGDFYACLKIINLIEKLSDKLTIVAFNEVKSGSFLATQSRCRRRLAIPNTKFIFHRARDIFTQDMMDDNFTMGQEEYRGRLNRLMVIDAMQLIKFIEKGKPISKIIELFREEATLSVKRALKYKLIDGIMGKNEFSRYQKQLGKEQT